MILVTGGAGYIGSHTNKLLLREGYETVVLDNLVHGHRENVVGGVFVEGDVSDSDLLDRLFSECEIDAVIHFAAFAYVGESVADPAKYYKNNVANTISLLDAMVRHGVRKIIFSSTCATYGVPDRNPIVEEESQDPVNPYGASKWMIERIIKDYASAYGFSYCIFRYFNAAGADPDCEIGEWHVPETHIIPLILDVAMGRRDHLDVYGTDYDTRDGTCIRDYIHVWDLADAHLKAYEYLRAGESVCLNLGTMEGVSVLELIHVAQKVTGRAIKFTSAARRPGDPPELIGGMKKAEKVLGWKPIHSKIGTVISDAWNWHLKLYGEKEGRE